MSEIIQWVVANKVAIIAAVGGIVIAARVIVKLTPTPRDDSILEKIVNILKTIGLHVKD